MDDADAIRLATGICLECRIREMTTDSLMGKGNLSSNFVAARQIPGVLVGSLTAILASQQHRWIWRKQIISEWGGPILASEALANLAAFVSRRHQRFQNLGFGDVL